MFKSIIDFYRVSQAKPCNGGALSSNSLSSDFRPEDRRRLKRLQWSTFLAATLGYGMYYVCRLSLNVVKKPIVDEGVFSETELGIMAPSCSLPMLSVSLRTVSLRTVAISTASCQPVCW